MRSVTILLFCLLPFVATGCIRTLIYQKTQTPNSFFSDATTNYGWELKHFKPEPEVELVGLEKPPESADSPWVLFFGGNALPISASVSILESNNDGHDRGSAVYAYRGYDGSTGEPTEYNLVADAEQVALDVIARRGLAPKRFYILGYSLGTGVAAQLTVKLLKRKIVPAGLILVSPYTELSEVVAEMIPWIPLGWLLPDRFNTRSILKDITLPVLVLHGSDDRLISVEQGKLIAKQLGIQATFVELSGRGHNDIFNDRRTAKILSDFMGKADF